MHRLRLGLEGQALETRHWSRLSHHSATDPMAATSYTGAERIPSGDYSVPHRSPPPVPSVAYSTTEASTQPQFLHEPGRPSGAYASETGSVKSHHSRRGSLGSLLRRKSSHNSALHNGNTDDVPPVPSVPATRIAQAHQAAAAASQNGGRISSSSNRKTSTEGGRSMLRKSSKLKAAQEAERLEQERLARQRAPPPRLPTHNPLPGIDSFGGDESQQNRTNFSRPGYNMPSSNYNGNSSSPAYAVRGGQVPGSAPGGKTNGEYVDSSSVAERHESMTHRGRYSYASSIAPINMNSPRRIRRRKDPTPFK